MKKNGRISVIVTVALVAAMAIGITAAPSGAAAGGGNCKLSGSANFDQGLNTTAKAFTYGFSGTLSECADLAGPAKGGSVQAGGTWTDANGTFQLPKASGNGSCASSTTAGTAVIKWADGGVTVIKYDTTGAAAAVALKGSVQPSLTLNNGTASTTIVSTRYFNAGQQNGVAGQLAFHPADPTACNSATGVTASPIDGFTQVGTL